MLDDQQSKSNGNERTEENIRERFKNILMAEVGKIHQKKEKLQNSDMPQEEKAKIKTDNKIIQQRKIDKWKDTYVLNSQAQESMQSGKKKKQPTIYTEEEIKALPYKCKFPECLQRFKVCSALGGHISKAHPGQSIAYNHKKTVRDRRELERILHKHAMDHYVSIEQDSTILQQVKN